MRILLAEDEPMDRELLVAYLVTWGHEVIPCTDGNEAWERLQQPSSPRLALLDWMMPGMDGVELCRRIRRSGNQTRTHVILVTGKNRREDIVAGLAAGADDYVVKPFDQEELRARVNVGVRVVGLCEQLVKSERLRVLVETAGASAHEVSQPLSVVLGLSQLLSQMDGLPEGAPDKLDRLELAARRLGDIVRRMQNVQTYATREYVEGSKIVDFGGEAGS